MNIKKYAQHWQYTASRDWKTAGGLLSLKRNDACLFFCHLTLEKLLKGLIVIHTKQHPPYVHDLERLSIMAGLVLTQNQIDDLKSISAFNIAGRYSDYKLAFYKTCTQVYTKKYVAKTKQLITCLKKHYPKH